MNIKSNFTKLLYFVIEDYGLVIVVNSLFANKILQIVNNYSDNTTESTNNYKDIFFIF